MLSALPQLIAMNLTQTTMTEENSDRSVSRRKFLGVGSAAIGATMIAAATAAAQNAARHGEGGARPKREQSAQAGRGAR